MQNPGGLRDGTGSIALRAAVCFIHLRLRLHLLLQTLCGLDISSFFSLVWALPRKDFRLRLRHLLMFRPLEPGPSSKAKSSVATSSTATPQQDEKALQAISNQLVEIRAVLGMVGAKHLKTQVG